MQAQDWYKQRMFSLTQAECLMLIVLCCWLPVQCLHQPVVLPFLFVSVTPSFIAEMHGVNTPGLTCHQHETHSVSRCVPVAFELARHQRASVDVGDAFI